MVITINDLQKFCTEQIRKGKGNQSIYISDNNEEIKKESKTDKVANEFKGYTPYMLKELAADENKPVIIICGGTQNIVKHAFIAEDTEEFKKKQLGSLVIDMDV